jgi:glycosyltransferase involved in cell wall biosynthesis
MRPRGRLGGAGSSVSVTVAIPVRDGGQLLARTLAALAAQTVEHELLICDSGSIDGSLGVARAHGARLLEIPPSRFSHGATRNLLMEQASGARVAFLTQDAEPADERWLERLLGGLELAPDVGLAFGPYRPRPEASLAVRLELERWFASLAPDGEPRVERLSERERATLQTRALIGRRGFFTDANACLTRSAWERVPFREVAYAEDRVLAVDALRAGYAKAYVPDAAVLHSHDYSYTQELRRCFDEWRGLRQVYGWRQPLGPTHLVRGLRGELAPARRELLRTHAPRSRRRAALAAVGFRHLARLIGAALGSRADLLPASLCSRLSLEGSDAFVPLDLDAWAASASGDTSS